MVEREEQQMERREKRKQRFARWRKSGLRSFFVSSLALLGARASYDYVQQKSPQYRIDKKLDRDAALILPQLGLIEKYCIPCGKEILVSVRDYNYHDVLASQTRPKRLCVRLNNLELLSEWFKSPKTAEGDARNLDVLIFREPGMPEYNISLTRDEIPGKWQKFYEDLITLLANEVLQSRKTKLPSYAITTGYLESFFKEWNFLTAKCVNSCTFAISELDPLLEHTSSTTITSN